MSKKKTQDIPSGFNTTKSFREQLDEIVNSDLTYDQKLGSLTKMVTKSEARALLGPDPAKNKNTHQDPFETLSLIDPLGDETLFLIIEKYYFDQIMSGEKVEEYRNISPSMPGRYTYKGKDGKRHLRPFGKIKFAVGYHQNREMAVVEVKDIQADGDFLTYYLGKILEYIPKK